MNLIFKNSFSYLTLHYPDSTLYIIITYLHMLFQSNHLESGANEPIARMDVHGIKLKMRGYVKISDS